MASPAKSLPAKPHPNKPHPNKPLMAALRLDLAHIEAGVPLSTITEFVATSGLPLKELYNVVIPARTLKHRRDKKQPLTRDESDKLARLVRVYDHAVKVFDGHERAGLWLGRPKDRFDGRTPLQMLQTDIGGRIVDEMLGQIEYGLFA